METLGLLGCLEICVLFQRPSLKEALSPAVFAGVKVTGDEELNKWAHKRPGFQVRIWEAIWLGVFCFRFFLKAVMVTVWKSVLESCRFTF